jgi:glycosyltransferase involved in cell wall biosynthesis
MKVIHINFSDTLGGAARAAYRIHSSLLQADIDSRMWVNHSLSGDWTVEGPNLKRDKALVLLRKQVGKAFSSVLKTSNPILHSPAILPSNWVRKINASDADVVNLHWVAGEMLSIKDIARIKKPVVWTLQDMWGFCGAEHYTNSQRWLDGYWAYNRPEDAAGFDLNRWIWERKLKNWKLPMQIIAPSDWLGECVSRSSLMKAWPVSIIPNPINTASWTPIKKAVARSLLGLPPGRSFLLFGAVEGTTNYYKGFDLLQAALTHLKGYAVAKDLQIIVFGKRPAKISLEDYSFPIHFAGYLHDDISLRLYYSAADVMVTPSRLEAFGQTASESLACGTPVVAFDNSGLYSVVSHQKTGYLAKAFDVTDLAYGISWVLKEKKNDFLNKNARLKAEESFSYSQVAEQYRLIYKKVISNRNLR